MNGINNLFDCGKRLNLKSHLIASAAIYYHKFFKNLNDQTSSDSIDSNLIACTCLYLAIKVEEHPIKCKDLLAAFNDCVNKDQNELTFHKFTELSNSIVYCEILICQLINFDLNNQLPHNYLLNYLKSFTEWLFDDSDQSVQFSNLCWSILTDFYRTDDCIAPFKPQEISIAILQIAIRVYKDNLKQILELEKCDLEQILNYTSKLYDQLDMDNLWTINLIIMKTFQFK